MILDRLNDGYFSTGFPGLDRLTGGLNRKRLLTFSAAPGGGMSTALLTVAAAAARQHVPTLYIDTESTEELVRSRLISNLSGITREALRGHLEGDDRDKTTLASEVIGAARFTIDTSVQSKNEILALALDLEPRLILIDGVRLLDAGRADTFAEDVAQTVIALKKMSGSLNAAICVTHPMPRSARPFDEPSVEPFVNHSDQFVLIKDNGWPGSVGGVEMNLMKNRSGPTETFCVTADFEHSRYLMPS